MKQCVLLAILTINAGCLAMPEAEHTEEVEQALDKCESVFDCSFIPVAPCSRPMCAEGVCIQDNTPNGEPADVPQIHGDCITLTCDKLDVVITAESHDIPFPPWECARSYCRETLPVIVELPCIDPLPPP